MRCENNAGKPWVLTPSADDFVEVKSGNFSVNCLRKIMTELLSVFLRLCVRLLSQSYCVGVNYQHCNLIYRGVMIWSVNAVVPNLHPFPPQPPPSSSCSSISHIGRCHFMPDDYSQPPVFLCPTRGSIYGFTALWKVRKSSWSATLLLLLILPYYQ